MIRGGHLSSASSNCCSLARSRAFLLRLSDTNDLWRGNVDELQEFNSPQWKWFYLSFLGILSASLLANILPWLHIFLRIFMFGDLGA